MLKIRLIRTPLQWLKDRSDYLHFKIKQFQSKRKARRSDTDIYPLW